MFVLSLCLWPFFLFCVCSCLFFGHSHFVFSFLNICFFLVSLSCCPFWMYLFFFWRFSLTWLSFFCPFFIFSLYILSCYLKKTTFFSTASVFALFFLRQRNGVFLLQFNIFHFLIVCFASLFPPFVHPLSICSLFFFVSSCFCRFVHLFLPFILNFFFFGIFIISVSLCKKLCQKYIFLDCSKTLFFSLLFSFKKTFSTVSFCIFLFFWKLCLVWTSFFSLLKNFTLYILSLIHKKRNVFS